MYRRTVDYPDEFANRHHVMLDTEVLVTCGGNRWSRRGGPLLRHGMAYSGTLTHDTEIWFFIIG